MIEFSIREIQLSIRTWFSQRAFEIVFLALFDCTIHTVYVTGRWGCRVKTINDLKSLFIPRLYFFLWFTTVGIRSAWWLVGSPMVLARYTHFQSILLELTRRQMNKQKSLVPNSANNNENKKKSIKKPSDGVIIN